jgi:hypothetical protein
MKLFYTALMTYFNVSNNFKTAIGGRLYQEVAPEHATYPYCVFDTIVNTQNDTFDTEMDDIIIQFSIFSKEVSSVEVHDAMTHLKALFNDCIFTVSGGTVVCFYRLNSGIEREEGSTPSAAEMVWHYHIDYNAIFQRD